MAMKTHVLTLIIGLGLVVVLAGCSQTDEDSDGAGQANPQGDAAQTVGREQPALSNYVAAAYPLDTCAVAGKKLGSMGEPIVLVHEGREVKFCCAGCEPKFKADPDAFLAKIDAAVIAQQSEQYPVATCVISGDALGEGATDFVYENRLVRFCCDMCIDTFLKNPNAALAKLNDAAVTAQLVDYPAQTCPMTGLALGSMGKPIDMMVGDRLVRLCCAGCVDKVKQDPAAAMAQAYAEGDALDAE